MQSQLNSIYNSRNSLRKEVHNKYDSIINVKRTVEEKSLADRGSVFAKDLNGSKSETGLYKMNQLDRRP